MARVALDAAIRSDPRFETLTKYFINAVDSDLRLIDWDAFVHAADPGDRFLMQLLVAGISGFIELPSTTAPPDSLDSSYRVKLKAAEDKAARAEEGRVAAERANRLLLLQKAEKKNIDQIFTSRKLPSSSTPEHLPAITYKAATVACLEGMNTDSVALDIATVVAQEMNRITLPDDDADEVKMWHPHFRKLLTFVQRAARIRGLETLKPFPELAPLSGGEDKRADFTFTEPHEQRLELSNACTWLEIKRVVRGEVKAPALMREAVAQVIKYMAIRQRQLGDYKTERAGAIALCTTGMANLVIVRTEFGDAGAPVLVSEPLALLLPAAAAGAGGAATGEGGAATGAVGAAAAPPPGLVALVRVLLTTSAAAFGLDGVTYYPRDDSGFMRGHVLGDGGFATVVQLNPTAGGATPLACKFLRGRGEEERLTSELQVLRALGSAGGVPGVPRLASDKLETSRGDKPGLWLRPVGEHVNTTDVSPAVILDTLWGVLVAAHARRYMHMDVRPSNIIMCAAEDGSRLVVLIDWGLAERVDAAARPVADMYGERAFLSTRRLELRRDFETCETAKERAAMKWTPTAADDFDAAIWTFIAFVAHARGLAPWRGEFLSSAGDELCARKDWVCAHAARLDENLRGCSNDSARHACQEVMALMIPS